MDPHATYSPRPRKYAVTWACSSMGMPEAGLDELLPMAMTWGIEELELRTLEDSIDLPSVLKQRYGTPEAFAAHLERQPGVKIAVLSASLRLADNTQEDRYAFLAYVPWAEAAGVPWLRAFDFVGPYAPWSDEMFDRSVDTLRWWRDQKKRNGWRTGLIVEGHHRLFYPDMYRKISDAIGWSPALLFDLGHALRELGNNGALAAYRELSAHIPRVHLKDPAPAVSDGMKHTIPGAGTGNLDAFMAAFASQEKPPVVTLEWERQWEKRLPPLAVALAALRDRRWL